MQNKSILTQSLLTGIIVSGLAIAPAAIAQSQDSADQTQDSVNQMQDAADQDAADQSQDYQTQDRTGDPDARESSQPAKDTWITTKIKTELLANRDVSGLAIDVDTVNGVVHLSGEVNTQAEADTAGAVAKTVEGVTDVDVSELVVGER